MADSSMHREFSIRDAGTHEAGAMSGLAMRSKAHWGYSPGFMEACRNELSVSSEKIGDDGFLYRVVVRRGRVVGFYALERLSDADFELEALFVEPEHIGTGVGKSLMSDAKERAASLGARKLVIQGDPKAERFYRAAGGVLVGKRESASVSGRFLPVFEVPLG